ncbi:hypothetical protein ACLOJK_026234 [Asimina triloba]
MGEVVPFSCVQDSESIVAPGNWFYSKNKIAGRGSAPRLRSDHDYPNKASLPPVNTCAATAPVYMAETNGRL